MNPLPLHFPIVPLSNIAVSLIWLPYARSMLASISPLPFIFFPIFPYENPLSISQPILEFTFVVTLRSNFVTLIFRIIRPLSLKSWIFADTNSRPYSLPIGHATEIYFIIIHDDLKIRIFYQIINFKMRVDCLILSDVIRYFLFLGNTHFFERRLFPHFLNVGLRLFMMLFVRQEFEKVRLKLKDVYSMPLSNVLWDGCLSFCYSI